MRVLVVLIVLLQATCVMSQELDPSKGFRDRAMVEIERQKLDVQQQQLWIQKQQLYGLNQQQFMLASRPLFMEIEVLRDRAERAELDAIKAKREIVKLEISLNNAERKLKEIPDLEERIRELNELRFVVVEAILGRADRLQDLMDWSVKEYKVDHKLKIEVIK